MHGALSRRPAAAVRRVGLGLAALGLTGLALAACSSRPGSAGGRVPVVAAENFWGSIAVQLGGSHVQVSTILTDPNADPHEYSSSAADARALAQARYVVINGAGYDDWARKLLAGNPSSSRQVLDVGTLVGRRPGQNPHVWYDPGVVTRVASRISADLAELDPPHAAYYRARHRALAAALAPYRQRLTAIRARYGGVAVAATESIFAPLAGALGLRLITPPDFMKAAADNVEPPAAALIAMSQQLARRQPRVLVYNVQTISPVTASARRQAQAQGIPVVGLSETLRPPGTTFQDWQVAELDALAAALARGGRAG